jgi:hypothetical protein
MKALSHTSALCAHVCFADKTSNLMWEVAAGCGVISILFGCGITIARSAESKPRSANTEACPRSCIHSNNCTINFAREIASDDISRLVLLFEFCTAPNVADCCINNSRA